MIDLHVINDESHYLLIAKRNKNVLYIRRLNQALKILQPRMTPQKFNDLITHKLQIKKGEFKEMQYIQNACEVTIAAYFAEKFPSTFIYENKVNPPTDKDCDLTVQHAGIDVNIEVKCLDNSQNEAIHADKSVRFMGTFGRYPDKEFLEDVMSQQNETSKENPSIDATKELVYKTNRDTKLQTYLSSAQEKFSDDYPKNHINILFICIGDATDIDEWDGYMYGHQGIFTENSFIPHELFDKVDAVIISNLQYKHSNFFDKETVTDHWKLNRAYAILHKNKYSKNYKNNNQEWWNTLDAVMPNIVKDTQDMVTYTNSEKEVDPFRNSIYIEYLNKESDKRF